TATYPLSLHDALPICRGGSGTSESRCLIPKEQLASSKRPPATQAPPCHSCCILCCCIWCCIWCQTLFTTTPLCGFAAPPAHLSRSEEHTSELQSRENL